tara:strand:+ start:1873 stop:2067 length:195 start_codon:yes stop_codon:yes gene_type:complete
MKQTIKVIAVTAAGFALGYALYSMLSTRGVVTTKSEEIESEDTSPLAKYSPDEIGAAVAGVMID